MNSIIFYFCTGEIDLFYVFLMTFISLVPTATFCHILSLIMELQHFQVVVFPPCNTLRRGYNNAAVVPCVCVRPSMDLVNTIETTPLCASWSNLATC